MKNDDEDPGWVGTISPAPGSEPPYMRSLSHISESSADLMVDSTDVTSLVSGISINDIDVPSRSSEPVSPALIHTDISPSIRVVEESPAASPIVSLPQSDEQNSFFEPDPLSDDTDTWAGTYRAKRVPVEEDRAFVGASCDSVVDSELEDALEILLSALDDYRGQFPELQTLEQNLRLLQVTLKVRMRNKKAKL